MFQGFGGEDALCVPTEVFCLSLIIADRAWDERAWDKGQTKACSTLSTVGRMVQGLFLHNMHSTGLQADTTQSCVQYRGWYA